MKKNLPYLRFIGHRGKIKIYLVDGGYVRTNLDEEFTNFGQHYRFNCIPEYEFWLENEAAPDERRFFIDHLLVEWKLMNQGLSYDTAITYASSKERSERARSRDPGKILNRAGIPDPAKVHLRLLSDTTAGIKIWLIDGRLVRSDFYIDFTEGGHEFVYDFVPPLEVWLDNDLTPSEYPFVLLHELFERNLMAKGMVYNNAHRRASKLEWSCRHNQNKLIAKLTSFGISPEKLK
jgi:hypothetical protein